MTLVGLVAALVALLGLAAGLLHLGQYGLRVGQRVAGTCLQRSRLQRRIDRDVGAGRAIAFNPRLARRTRAAVPGAAHPFLPVQKLALRIPSASGSNTGSRPSFFCRS